MRQVEVLLLTTPACHLCRFAKGVLDTLGHDFAITVTEQSFLSEQGQQLAARDAIAFPPGIYVDGRFFAYGRLSATKLRRHIEATQA